MKTRTLVAVGLVVAGCGHARIPDALLEADSSKLDPAVAAHLEAARGEAQQAKGELERAGQEVGVAREEEARGEADRKKAEEEVSRVKELAAQAEARSRAADAHLDYAGKLVEARKAGEEAARRRIELADAKLEALKLQALQQANPQSVAKYDRAEFDERVAKSQRKLDEAREAVRKLEEEAKGEQRQWDELSRKAPRS